MSAIEFPWQVGQQLPALTLPPVERLDLIRYAGASGDFNPIHTIDAEATAAGLPGVIQHGMLTMAHMGALFSPYLDHGFVERMDTRFARMVALGDVLRVEAGVQSIERTEQGDRYTCAVTALNQRGEPVATGTVVFRAYP